MLCAKDKRFQIFQHASNVGFYKNFERALGYVTADADYVALCDQDDYWYPEKLTRLTNAFTQDTTLVYSDMRLVDRQGATISNTYWTGRKNNYTNLRVLMAANTITGSACVFGKNLLDAILPFPHRVSDAYHDHWIALVALMVGTIKYVDEPLYSYRQHTENIIGYAGLEEKKFSGSIWKALRNQLSGMLIPQVLRDEIKSPLAKLPKFDSESHLRKKLLILILMLN